jgi:hypothetical protein
MQITRETKADELVELKKSLGEIEMSVITEGITLSALIREGCLVTDKANGWGSGNNACAMSAAAIALTARNK